MLLLGLWLGSGADLFAQAEKLEESYKKEVYIKRAQALWIFADATRWMNDGVTNKAEPFILGILGDDPWNGGFSAVRGVTKIQGRPVTLKVFSGVEKLDKCHLLFIRSGFDKTVLKRVLETIKGQRVLTVAESKEFAQMGGMINLYIKDADDSIATIYDVNAEAATQAGLKFDLVVLQLAARHFPKRK